jgi:hypothetical protein
VTDDNQNKFWSMSNHPSLGRDIHTPISFYTAGSNNRLIGSNFTIQQSHTGYKEFPDGGDPAFRAVLAKMLTIHISKSHDYGTGRDPYANYVAAEVIGVPAWKSCFARALEKVQRLTNAFSGLKLKNENVSDSLLDLANQIVITKVLLDREVEPE